MDSSPDASPSLGIGQAIAAFMGAVHTLGAASARWSKRKSEATAAELGASLDAVDTALAMVVLSVGNGVEHTRREIHAWQQERGDIMPESRINLPPADWRS